MSPSYLNPCRARIQSWRRQRVAPIPRNPADEAANDAQTFRVKRAAPYRCTSLCEPKQMVAQNQLKTNKDALPDSDDSPVEIREDTFITLSTTTCTLPP